MIDAARGRGSHQFPVGLRGLAPAKIAQCPGGVSEHADLVVFAEQGQQGTESTLLENVIPALGAITSDVTQSPNGLFPNIEHWGREQLDEFRNGLGADNDLSVLSGTRGDIGERPRGLELWHKTGQQPRLRWLRVSERTCSMEWPVWRNSTKRGTTPHSITRSIGGFFSFDKSLRNLVVASSWRSGSSEKTPEIISSAS